MRTRIVRIGNSKGVRIPRMLLEQSGLGEEVELEVQAGGIVIRPARQGREGWDEAFARMADVGDDELLDPGLPSVTRWDDEEWEW